MNCQKCRIPLKLDNSLQDLNPATYDLLVGLCAWREGDVDFVTDGDTYRL